MLTARPGEPGQKQPTSEALLAKESEALSAKEIEALLAKGSEALLAKEFEKLARRILEPRFQSDYIQAANRLLDARKSYAGQLRDCDCEECSKITPSKKILYALMEEIRSTVCSGEGNAFYVLAIAETLCCIAGAIQAATLSEKDLILCETIAKETYLEGLRLGRTFREPKKG